MSTISIHLTDEEAALLRKYASVEGITPSEFARAAILEKIEDAYDLKEVRQAMAEDDGTRISIDELLAEL